MVGMPFAVAFLALFMSLAALQFYSSIGLDELVGAMTPAQAVRALLPVATMGTFLAAVASIYQRHPSASYAGRWASWISSPCNRRLRGVDDGARAREIGTAAAMFFLLQRRPPSSSAWRSSSFTSALAAAAPSPERGLFRSSSRSWPERL
jgi:hypothetical protein